MTEKVSFFLLTFTFWFLSIINSGYKCWKGLIDVDYDLPEMSNTEDNNPEKPATLRVIYTANDSIRLPIKSSRTINSDSGEKKNVWKSVINYSITFNSSFLIVGGLSESYLYGLPMLGNILSVCIGHVYSILIIYPFMYSLSGSCRTPYDYLKLRYNHEGPKIVCLLVGVFYYFSFLSLYLWGCAAILNMLAPEFDLQSANVVLGLYSVLGSLFGGYSQATVTNIFQFLVAFMGIIIGMRLTLDKSDAVGSMEKIWSFVGDKNRTRLFDSSVDISTRYTILNQLVSLPLPWCSKLGLFLPNYIRYRSIHPKSTSRVLFLSSLPLSILINMILILAGSLFCFVYFYGCDPYKSSTVSNKNQIGIFWLHSILSEKLPSFSGVVFACIVYHAVVQHSAGISLISKTLNDELTDKFSPGETPSKLAERIISVLISLASIPYSISFQYSRNTMLSLFYVFNNSLNSPILGVFLLSMFNPYANYVGMLAAFILNLAINCWMVLGSLISQTMSQEFPHHSLYCSNMSAPEPISTQPNPNNWFLFQLYSVAPIWYCLFSVVFSFTMGSFISLVFSVIKTGGLDVDYRFRHERQKYLFFYRLRNNF